jgi:hypothetical protein
MKTRLAALALALISTAALAQSSSGRSDDRWNITGPNWYETKCGQAGFSVTHGLPYSGKRVTPCSVPVRVCEYKQVTFSFIADPDRPCEQMIRPLPEGGLVRSYLKTWN